jgi:hypothetical protein
VLSCLVFLLGIVLHPEEFDHGARLIRLLTTDIGRYALLPFLIGACGLFALGLLTTGLGRCVAIEAGTDALVVAGLWGSRRIAWGQLGRIEIERTRFRGSTGYRLIFRGGGRTAKVPVALTGLHDDGIRGLVERIEAMRRGTGRPQAARELYAYTPAAVGPAGFGRKRN